MRARWLIVLAVVTASAVLSSAAVRQTAAQLYQSGLYAEEIEGNLQKAIGVYEQVLKQFPNSKDTAANAQLHIGLCYEKLGLEKAREAYEKVVRNYPGQSAAAVAQEKLDAILRAAAAKKGPAELTIRSVPIPPDPPLELYPVSPDGKFLAFVDGNVGDVGVKELSTGKLRRLTNEGNNYWNFAYNLRWSSDSTRLAYAWQRADRLVDLRTVALDGAAPKVLARSPDGEAIDPLDWSPDGASIASMIWRRGEVQQVLSLVSVGDGSVRTIRTFKNRNVAPGRCLFSPDGRYITYSRSTQEGARERDVFLLTLDGSREVPLVEHQADDTLLEWVPDGRGVLFLSDRAGAMDVWFLQVEKGLPQGVPVLVKRGVGPITPMGIARPGGFYYRTPAAFLDVFTASMDPTTGAVVGAPRKEPLPFEGHNRMPDWSPDGKSLAYTSTRPGEKRGVVCIYSADTGKVREFRLEKSGGYPRWTPDGRYLYLTASVMDGRGIYRFDVRTGDVTPVLGVGADEAVFSLRSSPDQRWFVYTREGKAINRVIRRDARSGQEVELDRGLDASYVALSPDGTLAAWIIKTDDKTRSLKVTGFPDGTPKEIYRFAMVAHWNFDLAWSPDGRFIYFFDRAPGSREWRLNRISAEGGEAQDLGLGSRYFEQISVHPDGTRITYSGPPTTMETSQVWVMENFLPRGKETK